MNIRGAKKKDSDPVTVKGPWLPVSLTFLRSRAWCDLSPHAAKMLFDLCAGLGKNAALNGDLSASPTIMIPKGWSGNATRVAALQELEEARLISITRRGNRRLCGLYAVTLWPMKCDFSKLDHGPGSYVTTDWESVSADRAKTPTTDAPAKWKPLRKTQTVNPPRDNPPIDVNPQRDNQAAVIDGYEPATGSKGPVSAVQVVSLRDTFLDAPSAVGGGAVSEPARTVPPCLTSPFIALDGIWRRACTQHIH